MGQCALLNSGGGTRYELDKEIKTGDFWINGKPIYSRTFKFHSNGNDLQKSEVLSFEELISLKYVLKIFTSDREAFYREGDYDKISVHINQQNICQLENQNAFKVDCVAEILYTKSGV